MAKKKQGKIFKGNPLRNVVKDASKRIKNAVWQASSPVHIPQYIYVVIPYKKYTGKYLRT